MAKTESAEFKPTSPIQVLRKMQAEQDYVWYAAYDEDILYSNFI